MRTRHFFLGKFRGVKTGRAPARADSVPLYGVPNLLKNKSESLLYTDARKVRRFRETKLGGRPQEPTPSHGAAFLPLHAATPTRDWPRTGPRTFNLHTTCFLDAL